MNTRVSICLSDAELAVSALRTPEKAGEEAPVPCYECGSTERIGTACAPCNPELVAQQAVVSEGMVVEALVKALKWVPFRDPDGTGYAEADRALINACLKALVPDNEPRGASLSNHQRTAFKAQGSIAPPPSSAGEA